MKDKFKYILFLVVIIMVAANPSLKDFQGHDETNKHELATRKYNFLIFSIYSDPGMAQAGQAPAQQLYFGILDNFIEL